MPAEAVSTILIAWNHRIIIWVLNSLVACQMYDRHRSQETVRYSGPQKQLPVAWLLFWDMCKFWMQGRVKYSCHSAVVPSCTERYRAALVFWVWHTNTACVALSSTEIQNRTDWPLLIYLTPMLPFSCVSWLHASHICFNHPFSRKQKSRRHRNNLFSCGNRQQLPTFLGEAVQALHTIFCHYCRYTRAFAGGTCVVTQIEDISRLGLHWSGWYLWKGNGGGVSQAFRRILDSIVYIALYNIFFPI